MIPPSLLLGTCSPSKGCTAAAARIFCILACEIYDESIASELRLHSCYNTLTTLANRSSHAHKHRSSNNFRNHPNIDITSSSFSRAERWDFISMTCICLISDLLDLDPNVSPFKLYYKSISKFKRLSSIRPIHHNLTQNRLRPGDRDSVLSGSLTASQGPEAWA